MSTESSLVSVGKAILTMLESRVAMNVPQATEASTHHFRGMLKTPYQGSQAHSIGTLYGPLRHRERLVRSRHDPSRALRPGRPIPRSDHPDDRRGQVRASRGEPFGHRSSDRSLVLGDARSG